MAIRRLPAIARSTAAIQSLVARTLVIPRRNPATLFVAILVIRAGDDVDLRLADVVLLGQLRRDLAVAYAADPQAVVDELLECVRDKIRRAPPAPD